MKTKLLSILLLFSFGVMAQNARIGQYMFRKNLVNVAAMGANEGMSVSNYYRKQWAGFNGSPLNMGLDGTYMLTDNHFVGANIYSNSIGDGFINDYDISASYAFRIVFDKVRSKYNNGHYVSFGLSMGWRYFQVDGSKIDPEFSDPTVSNYNSKISAMGAKMGVYYYNQGFYSGISIPDIVNENPLADEDVFINLQKMNYNWLVGYNWIIDRIWSLDMSGYLKVFDESRTQFEVNAIATYDNLISGGLNYRSNNEMMVLFQIKFLEDWKVGYAFEYKLDNSTLSKAGTHEIMITYELFNNRKR